MEVKTIMATAEEEEAADQPHPAEPGLAALEHRETVITEAIPVAQAELRGVPVRGLPAQVLRGLRGLLVLGVLLVLGRILEMVL